MAIFLAAGLCLRKGRDAVFGDFEKRIYEWDKSLKSSILYMRL